MRYEHNTCVMKITSQGRNPPARRPATLQLAPQTVTIHGVVGAVFVRSSRGGLDRPPALGTFRGTRGLIFQRSRAGPPAGHLL